MLFLALTFSIGSPIINFVFLALRAILLFFPVFLISPLGLRLRHVDCLECLVRKALEEVKVAMPDGALNVAFFFTPFEVMGGEIVEDLR